MMLTLCQTEVGAGMPQAVKSAVTGSTNIKLMGPIGSDHWSSVASLVNLRREDFEQLRIGQFYLSFGRGNPTIKFNTGKEFVGNAHSMTSAQWAKVRARHWSGTTDPCVHLSKSCRRSARRGRLAPPYGPGEPSK